MSSVSKSREPETVTWSSDPICPPLGSTFVISGSAAFRKRPRTYVKKKRREMLFIN
jgi:hypothetical protein